jgi:addiction module HigA family antidote
MPRTEKNPASVLRSLIDEYQINPFSLSKSINLNYQTVQRILKGKGKITVPTALRLGKYFGQSPAYWIDIQYSSEINKLAKNKKFISMIKSIQKAQKPAAKAETKSSKSKAKTTKRKTKTLAEKRKKAAKVPGTRGAKRKRSKKGRT